MRSRPPLLFYCQHSLGLGHLARSLALCGALAVDFRVTLLSGGRLPSSSTVPDGVEVVELPALALAPDGELVSEDPRLTVELARAQRTEAILAAVRSTRPAALVIELFPFGRRKFAAELTAMLEEAQRPGGSRPLVACSVRDILVSRGDAQRRHDERACRLANRWFDLILVHSDPGLARLEDSFDPPVALEVPVHHTGFVLPPGPIRAVAGSAGAVVVSAGGGRVGNSLLRTAVDAHGLLAGRAMKVIAGPFLPADEWRSLRAAARGRDGLELVRSVPSLEAELRTASAAVSQCGYNTALEILRSRVPALVVPFAKPGEDEQTRRARRLVSLGAVRMLEERRLDPGLLAAEIEALDGFRPRAPRVALDGAHNSAQLLRGLVGARVAA